MSQTKKRAFQRYVGLGWTALLLVTTLPSLAVDGVLEINQACVATGCFPGDSAGFPVEITASGSYRLTGNLAVPDENTTAVEIAADGVSLDLNGFEISGVTSCFGSPISCTPTGTGDGVSLSSGTATVISNGTIRGMGRFGVRIPGNGPSRVERLIARENGLIGIMVGDAATISSSAAESNGTEGIFTGGHSLVRDSIASRNGAEGILVNSISMLINNNATSNGGHGFTALLGSVVIGNSAGANGGFGLDPGGSSSVGYANNVFTNNNGGNANNQVGGGGTEIGANLCGTNATCP